MAMGRLVKYSGNSIRSKPIIRSYKKRRVYRRKRRYVKKRNAPYTKISKMPVPERYFTKLRYSELLTFSLPSASTLVSYLYRSSIFDPDYSGAGHQPLWRDQLALLYNKYRVYGIKYYITFKNSNVQQLTWAYVKHSDNSTAEVTPTTLRERAEGRGVMLDANSGRANLIKGYLSVPKCFGLSKKEFCEDDTFISQMTTNPASTAFLHIYALTMNTSCIIHCQIDLVYYVEFFDRIDVTGS